MFLIVCLLLAICSAQAQWGYGYPMYGGYGGYGGYGYPMYGGYGGYGGYGMSPLSGALRGALMGAMMGGMMGKK